MHPATAGRVLAVVGVVSVMNPKICKHSSSLGCRVTPDREGLTLYFPLWIQVSPAGSDLLHPTRSYRGSLLPAWLTSSPSCPCAVRHICVTVVKGRITHGGVKNVFVALLILLRVEEKIMQWDKSGNCCLPVLYLEISVGEITLFPVVFRKISVKSRNTGVKIAMMEMACTCVDQWLSGFLAAPVMFTQT